MSLEFRQKSAGEIAKILKRHNWKLFLPTLAFGIAFGWVVWKLPNFYQSTTFLTLKPPTISEKVVQSLSDEDLSQSLQTINQEVLSRSSLEPMIAKYNLFESEKASGMDMGLIVDKMRKAIEVKPDKTDNDKVVGFRITYHDRTPKAAQLVTAELAGKYVNSQIEVSTKNVETTREFIERQVAEAKAALDSYEKQRLDIMSQNIETLPESAQGLIAQLDGLHKREETLAKDKESLNAEKGRLNDAIRTYESQTRLVEDFGQRDADTAAKNASDYKRNPAYSDMIKRKTELEAKFENIKKVWKPVSPEYIAVKTELDKVNGELVRMAEDAKESAEQAKQSTTTKSDYQKDQIKIEKQRAQDQITQIDSMIQAKALEQQQNAVQISALEAKINAIPSVKVALESINNQYQTAKQKYDDLLKKQNDVQLQLERTSNAQGETIRVVDVANLPQTPMNATKKPMFAAVGAGIGLLIGFLMTAFIEIPRLLKIQNIEDAKHYTGLPVLASVPPLLTHNELSWQKRLYWLKVMAGIIIAFASIPLLIMGLEASRILDKLVS